MYTVDELLDWVNDADVEGLTVTGGEPLDQPIGVCAMCSAVRSEGLSVLLFTGYPWRWLTEHRAEVAEELRQCTDVVISGPFSRRLRTGSGLRGSSNQRVHLFSDRYTLRDIEVVPPAEAVISPQGNVILSGVDPLDYHSLAGERVFDR